MSRFSTTTRHENNRPVLHARAHSPILYNSSHPSSHASSQEEVIAAGVKLSSPPALRGGVVTFITEQNATENKTLQGPLRLDVGVVVENGVALHDAATHSLWMALFLLATLRPPSAAKGPTTLHRLPKGLLLTICHPTYTLAELTISHLPLGAL